MSGIIGIKVPVDAPLAKCASVIRKLEAVSIAEVKRRICTEDFLYTCVYTDRSGVKRLILCCEQLKTCGVMFSIYEHGRPCNMKFLKNLSKMYDEIADDIRAEMDEESAAEEQ